MASTSEILTEITRAMEREIRNFDKGVPSIERLIYKRAVDLLKDLEVKNGKITNTVANIQAINKLKAEIESFILDKRYINSTKSFLTAFDMIEQLQLSYFSSLAVEVGRNKLLTAIKNDAINYTAKELTTQGVNAKVMPGIERLLRINITQGGSIATLMEELRRYITTTTDAKGITTHGALQRHTRQITTDALNQYSANYNETVSQDLGFKWRMYTGSLIETSREWCIHMVAKRYVHVSELNTVIHDNIDGVKICSEKIPCDKKTKLPRGMIEGTDVSNIAKRRGGWQCGHQFGGIPSAVVPKEIRSKFE